MARYVRIGGYRGYSIPRGAVVGSSDCGSWSDSPAPTALVEGELNRFRKGVLRPVGIRSRLRYSRSSNAFMLKRWVVVAESDFSRAAQLAADHLRDHEREYDYLHDASLEQLGIRAA